MEQPRPAKSNFSNFRWFQKNSIIVHRLGMVDAIVLTELFKLRRFVHCSDNLIWNAHSEKKLLETQTVLVAVVVDN